MKKFVISFSLFFLSIGLWAQHKAGHLHGRVTEADDQGKEQPLVGANVFWLGTTVGTITDERGIFHLDRSSQTTLLVISYVGYRTDTVDTRGKTDLSIQLAASTTIDEVAVSHRTKSTQISRVDPIKTYHIDEKELLKAACCNLSESFETNPSVDISFTDAVTGTRQIEMLGLAGPYTQITRENMPNVRWLAAVYGLTYIPGTWIESIQLIKGTGSVINGFESVAGQINTELRKPESAERMYLNTYVNENGRFEANANFAHRPEQGNWSTGLLLHGSMNSVEHDRNNDGFLDHPLGKQFIGLHRWKYIGDQGLRMQFGIKGTFVDNTGGQVNYNSEDDALSENSWGMGMNTRRIEGWAKFGMLNEALPWRSMALQLSGVSHSHKSNFGVRRYDAEQQSLYANLIYQTILANTRHSVRMGASFQYDNYDELIGDTSFAHTEIVPGAFFEYTFNHFEKFNLVAGLRTDYHSIHGPFITPRLHMRYALTERTILRTSAGRGQRTASIIAENIGLLASSREYRIEGNAEDHPYGLDPEVAWNYGISLTQHFWLDNREGTVSMDFYHTQFENQIVVDLDQSPQLALFYNLEGRSYSNSLQVQIDYELLKRFDVRLAYRLFDVKTTYSGELKQKPLQAAHRAFINLGYETFNHWKFDYTLNWQGSKRIPFTGSNPVEYQLPESSPDFFIMNVQVSKAWKEKFEVYAGVENLLDFRQEDPILASDQPFGPYFDSSLVWGPVFGRGIYMGLRLRLK